jgi:hypothetical protein
MGTAARTRRYATTTVIILSALALTAGTAHASITDDQTPSDQVGLSLVGTQPGNAMLNAIRYKVPAWPSDAGMLAFGVTICRAWGRGVTLQLDDVGVANGYTAGQAATIIGAAAGALCPEYAANVGGMRGVGV